LLARDWRMIGHPVENRRHDIIDIVDHHRLDEMGAVDETLPAHVLDKAEHRVPEAADIGECHRLLMAAKLTPGHDLDDLLQRTDAARKRNEGVRTLEHRMLAGMHVLGDDQFVELAERLARRLHIYKE